MKWKEIAILTSDEGMDIVCAQLNDIGVEQMVLEPGEEVIRQELEGAAQYWDFADANQLAGKYGPCIKIYIADLPENDGLIADIKRTAAKLKQKPCDIPLGSLQVVERLVDDEDWANSWKAFYKPTPVGERLLIKPSWESVDDPQGRVILQIDPGMVFGTGTHHTTRMCMEYLEQIVTPDASVLDLGCGSGILSIAALLLGAKRAMLVDIDPVADKTVAQNMDFNGIDADRYRVSIGNAVSDEAVQKAITDAGGYDIIVANIVANVIIALCPFVSALAGSGKLFLTSGIITERLDEVKNVLTSNGFEVLSTKISEDWSAILSRKL